MTLVLPVAHAKAWQLPSNAAVKSVSVPSTLLRQVMLNLLLNAIKAAGEGGWVNVFLTADADAVRFTVTNTGERLTAAALEGSVTAEAATIRGFGLWVCREVATQFGGGFSVDDAITNARGCFLDSEPGKHEEPLVD